MKSVKKTNSGILFLFEILMAYRILCTFVPIISVWSPTIINIPVIVLLYFVFINSIGVDGIIEIVKKLFPLALLYVLNNILRSPGTGFVDVVLSLMRFYIWPVGIFLIYKYKDYTVALHLLIVFLLGMTLSMVTTYLGNLEYPGVSRTMAHLHSDGQADLSRFYQRLNIGGFDFIYYLPFLAPLMLFIFKKVSKWWLKGLALGVLFVLALTVYEAHYTTALVLSAVSVTLLILPEKVDMKKMVFYYFILLFLLYFFASSVSLFLGQMSEKTDVGVYTERIGNISELFAGEDMSGDDANNRVLLYQKSLNSFVNNPLIGSTSSFGGHSFILDMLGGYGLLGLIVIIWGLSVLYKNCVRRYRGRYIYEFCIFLFVLQCTVGILNPVFSVEVFLLLIPLFDISSELLIKQTSK